MMGNYKKCNCNECMTCVRQVEEMEELKDILPFVCMGDSLCEHCEREDFCTRDNPESKECISAYFDYIDSILVNIKDS